MTTSEKPICHHLAYRVARSDALQEQAIVLSTTEEYPEARRILSSKLDRLLRNLGWVRLSTRQGKKWMREDRALKLIFEGVDIVEDGATVQAGYVHAKGRRKREAAMKIPAEVRRARAVKAAAASALARRKRRQKQEATDE